MRNIIGKNNLNPFRQFMNLFTAMIKTPMFTIAKKGMDTAILKSMETETLT